MDVPLELNYMNSIPFNGIHYQEKYWYNTHYLIKLDSKYRESSKEEDAFKIAQSLGLNAVEYKKIKVIHKGTVKNACVCRNFLDKGEVEIPVHRIFELCDYIADYKISANDYMDITVKLISKVTKLPKQTIYRWLYSMVIFDYIICNTDRNTSNFSVIYNKITNKYRLAPYFDNGVSFMQTNSDMAISEFRLRESLLEAKPFGKNPEDNLCDLNIARYYFNEMLYYCDGIAGLKEACSGINKSHLRTVIRRMEKLSNILDINY